MKVNRTVKAILYLSPKINKKEDKVCMKFSSNPNTSVQRYLNPLFQNQNPLFCCSLFFEEYLYPQVRMVNKYSVNYHPYLSRLTSRVLNFYKLLRVLSLSRMCLIFSQTCTVHSISMVEKKFQNYGVEIHRKYIYESKT